MMCQRILNTVDGPANTVINHIKSLVGMMEDKSECIRQPLTQYLYLGGKLNGWKLDANTKTYDMQRCGLGELTLPWRQGGVDLL